MKKTEPVLSDQYRRIAKAIKYVVDRQSEQPELGELAAAIGLSESQMQRSFKAWAGVSPKQFLSYLTKESAKRRLPDATVDSTALSLGLSGSSRLYDLMVNYEGVTPGEFKSGGAGLVIRYGVNPSPFGGCLLAITERGVCKLSFFDSAADLTKQQQGLFNAWPQAQFIADDVVTASLVQKIFSADAGAVTLKAIGTPFQFKVWEALLAIPSGELRTYGQVAKYLGKPSATRAVASAIAQNQIAYLIPCHRVIRASGALNQYRWGASRKAAMIGWEAC